MKLGIGLGAIALLLGVANTTSQAQSERRGPPIIRVYSDNGVDYVGTTTYITPRIELAENAYVFAIATDMDGEIQVLHPDQPGISVRISAHKSLQLPNFFAGFNSSRYGGASYAMDRDYYGFEDIRGTVIALASRVPFNLERIESNGDWDIGAIRRLIQNRSPLSAAAELAQYLGQPGEPIGRDYLRFEGARSSNYPYYAYSYYSPCGFYQPSFGFLRAYTVLNQLDAARRGLRLIGYDACGAPIFIAQPATGGQPTAIGHFPPPPPRGRGDTTVFPKSRLPHSPVPRGTTVFSNTLDAGMPSTRAAALPQSGDVTTKAAPIGRRNEPQQSTQEYRGAGMTIPQGRIPVERAVIPRGQASGTTVQTVPQYRREPRVEPAPVRVPERPRESSPPPVIHQRPSNPAPAPPPRVEAPTTRTEPARVPPPSRRN